MFGMEGKVLDVSELEAMGETLALAIGSAPQEFLLDPMLEEQFKAPLEEAARSVFGSWACRVVTDYCFGCNLWEPADPITGTAAEFIGVFDKVDIVQFRSDYFRDGIGGYVPAVRFSTVDDLNVSPSIAQSYLFCAMPLTQNLIFAERLAISQSDEEA